MEDNMMLEGGVVAEDTAEVTTDVDLSAFDDGWDSDGYPETFDAEETTEPETTEAPEVDQPTEAEAGAQPDEKPDEPVAEEPVTEEQGSGEDQLITVDFMDEHRQFDWKKDKDEIKTLLQKGMNYDRKVAKQEETISDYRSFLEDIAKPQNMTVEQLIDITRARVYMNSQKEAGRTLTEAQALMEIQSKKAEKAASEAEAKKNEAKAADESRRNELNRFIQNFPGVKAEEISKEVWAEFHKTGDLVAAYAKDQMSKQQQRIQTLENNRKNEERSMGSSKSAGSGKKRDAFDEGWDSAY